MPSAVLEEILKPDGILKIYNFEDIINVNNNNFYLKIFG